MSKAQIPKKLCAYFYRQPSGAEPVRDFLKELSKQDRITVGADIRSVEIGWPIGLPVCRPLGRKLYEVRSDISSRRICRVLFTIDGGEMVLLHAFIKKSQKTPTADINLARLRMK